MRYQQLTLRAAVMPVQEPAKQPLGEALFVFNISNGFSDFHSFIYKLDDYIFFYF